MKIEDLCIGSQARVVGSIFRGQVVTIHGHRQEMVLCYVTALDDIFEISLSPDLLMPTLDGDENREPNLAFPLLDWPLHDWRLPSAR